MKRALWLVMLVVGSLWWPAAPAHALTLQPPIDGPVLRRFDPPALD